jgi:probable HAF family extracellular repeat protein
MAIERGKRVGRVRGRASLSLLPLVVGAGFGIGCGGCSDAHGPQSGTPAAETVSGGAVATSGGAVAVGPCSAGMVAPSATATIVEIPSLGGDQVFVQDINNAGVAVGSQRAADGTFHAFRFTDEGGLTDLGAGAFASAIAADGTIGGHATHGDGKATGAMFGYSYTPAGGRVEVCQTPCSIWDVNAHGQVVGLMNDPQDALRWQAFIQDPVAGLKLLGTLGGARSSASGINEAGVVVGNAQPPGAAPTDVGHAFVYDAANGMRDLNALAGGSGAGWVLKAANDVSATAIVGYGRLGQHTRPFLFDRTTNMVRALGAADDTRDAFAWGVDAQGDVVGWSMRPDRLSEAFVYSANFGLRRLADFVEPSAAWDLQQASGLNDAGVIVGWGYHAGLVRGFKLTMPLCHAGG